MWKTILALLITIIVIPFLAFTFDEALYFQSARNTEMNW